MHKNSLVKQQVTRALVSWALLWGLLTLSSPTKLPVVVLIVPFIIIFLCIFYTWQLLTILWGRRDKSEGRQFSRKPGVTVALLLTVVLILQSLGQLTLRDVLTLLILFGLAYFYVIHMLAKN